MKLILFCGLILLALITSIIFSLNNYRNSKRAIKSIIKALLINLIILGIGSIWWVITESDGISQGIGVTIYLGSIIGISLINTVIILLLKNSDKSNYKS